MENQKQIFYLLHDFAFRVSVKYIGIENDPVEILYKAFARLFRKRPQPEMSVIDGYKEQSISSILQMSTGSLSRCLESAREQYLDY